LNDFITNIVPIGAAGGKSYGPIAVLGNVNAPGYHFSEQSNLTACSASDSGFTDYGLIVQGSLINSILKSTVRGNAYLYGAGNVNLEGTSCTAKPGADSTFDLRGGDAYEYASYYLSTLQPNLRIDDINILSSVGPKANPAYNVITLNSCRGIGGGCPDVPFIAQVLSDDRNHPQNLAVNISLLSDARGLLSQAYRYHGLDSPGIQWPKDATLVINVSQFIQVTCKLYKKWLTRFYT
jgi:hypothetical protein